MELLLAAGCGGHPPQLAGRGEAWPAADSAFRQEPKWLGGDGAYSCPLSEGRVLWLFGDTFVGIAEPPDRNKAKLPRNSVAIQTGGDLATAEMAFHWRVGAGGLPASFLPERADHWFWPGGCVRLPEGPLALFVSELRRAEGGLGFEGLGWALALVANPDDDPTAWNIEWLDPPAQAFNANPATAVTLYDEGGETFVAMLAAEDSAKHPGRVARIRTADLAAGALDGIEWWQSDAWVQARALEAEPTIVIDEAGPEASWHYDAKRGLWLHVFSAGFGASTIELRTAPRPTGPWSDSTTVFVPPENQLDDPFVYAAKAHPELTGPAGSPDALVITYATNSFEFEDLLTPVGQQTLYWPKVISVPLAPR